tara:strand:+ start:1110 stop:1973 length:864 start_codon:yes stop_codon:yes gene_type:complete
LLTLAVSEVEVETFILNIKPYCLTTLGKRPYSRFMAANILSESFNLETLSLIKEYLLSPNLGAVFLTMPEKKINIESYIQLLTGFSFLFGMAFEDEMTGKYYALHDMDRHVLGDSYLSEPYHDLRLHTDGTFYEPTTDFVFLAKIQQSSIEGGKLTLLAINELPELSEILDHTMADKNFYFKASQSKKIKKNVAKPIFTIKNNQVAIRFSDQFCYPDSLEAAKFLNYFSNIMELSSKKIIMDFPERSLLLLNNRYWLHGRTKFTLLEDGFKRQLLRIRGAFNDKQWC